MKKVNIKIEFEPRPIRHMAIQCPNCNNWFHGYDIVKENCDITYEHEIQFAECECPICKKSFDLKNIEMDENVKFPEFYANCKKKKVIFE